MPRHSPPQRAATDATLPSPDAIRPALGPGPWSLRRVGPFWLLLLVALLHGASHMDIGVDTWISLAGGRHVLAHGVTPAEPFSFNSRQPDVAADAGAAARFVAWLHPSGWINQNWLTHVVFAAAAGAFGLDALVVLKYLTYAAVAAILLLNARERRAHPALAIVLVAVALLAGRQFFEIRAQEATNLFACALMLVLTAATLRSPRAAWLLVPLFAVWGNTHGGFVWGLVAVAVFVAAGAAAARVGAPFLRIAPGTLRTIAAAGAGSLAAVVVLSPFRLANLTHPLVISVSADAREWRNVVEWLPLATGGAGEKVTFALIVALAAAAAFASARSRADRHATRTGDRDRAAGAAACPLDLGAAAVLLLTVAMAVASRRFVPMVHLLAAPLLAQWLTGAGARLAADPARFRRLRDAWARPAVARAASLALWLLAAAAAAGYGVAYARTYLGPWPFDSHRVSVADRALMSVGQPWEACRFVTENHLEGRMWTFWESGGFWAGCQPADPATGAVPVRVFIDGRAQAAYDAAVRRVYTLIEAGGPIGLRLDQAGRAPDERESLAIVEWVSAALAKDGIWLAHVAKRNLTTRAGAALLNLPTWQVVYLDEVHAVLVDIGTPQGTAAAAAVDRGEATFPTPLSRLLTLAHRAYRYGGQGGACRAVELARQAYALEPTQRAISITGAAGQDPQCLADAVALCRRAVADAIGRRVELAREHGNYQRLSAAAASAYFLHQEAQSRGDDAAVRAASEQLRWLTQEANALLPLAEW